jgi:hypothetical protein
MVNHLFEIKKSVSFIFILDSGGNLQPHGTGFFVGVSHEGNKNTLTSYFVTAKHVLQDLQGHYYPEIILRLNKLQGNSELIRIPTKDIKIIEHPDKDVDIAAFEFLPDVKIFDFKCISSTLIANTPLMEQHKITEGDDVFFAGLFTGHIGQIRNQPIIRFGKVSLISNEKILWQENNKPPTYRDLYLLECQSFGGNSGSPVFFDLSPVRNAGQLLVGGKQIFLAGVMTGSFLQGSNIQQVTETAASRLISLQNAGIAAVTPAEKLHHMLFSDELIEKRRQWDEHNAA